MLEGKKRRAGERSHCWSLKVEREIGETVIYTKTIDISLGLVQYDAV